MRKPEGQLARKTTHPFAHPQTCFGYLKSIFLQIYLVYNQGVRVRRLATNQKVGCSNHSGRTRKSGTYRKPSAEIAYYKRKSGGHARYRRPPGLPRRRDIPGEITRQAIIGL